MTHLPDIWACIKEYLPRNRWVPLEDIYVLIQRNIRLDYEDEQPQSPRSSIPKWKRNVRNVLQYRKMNDDIEWDRKGNYRMPGSRVRNPEFMVQGTRAFENESLSIETAVVENDKPRVARRRTHGSEAGIIPAHALDPLVLVENEALADPNFESWKDVTGERYHFPNQYRSKIKTGRQFLYYRGSRRADRKRGVPEYFGIGTIGEMWPDPDTLGESARKQKWYCEIEDYEPFSAPVPAKVGNRYFEDIAKNLWGVGVRIIDGATFASICRVAGTPLSSVESGSTQDPGFSAALDAPEAIEGESLLVPRKPRATLENGSGSSGSHRRSKFSKKVGDRAELAVIKHLMSVLARAEQDTIVWVARKGETPGWDIEFKRDDGKKICIEVKGTSGSRFQSIELTANEWRAAQKHKQHYWLCLVAVVGKQRPRIEFIKNPYGLHSKGELGAVPSAWNIFSVKEH